MYILADQVNSLYADRVFSIIHRIKYIIGTFYCACAIRWQAEYQNIRQHHAVLKISLYKDFEYL